MMSIPDILDPIKAGKLTATEAVEQALTRLEKLQPTYNIVINYTKERALKRAQQIDERLAKGEDVGRLAGVPFVTKDNFLAFGAPTTAGSNMLKEFEAPYQATAVERLEAEGAINIAKVNMDAFAHGGSTENSDFGPTKNPHDPTRVPGGSSGGSAAAVALGAVPFALGSDTGGSIRQPASFCGVVGVKPTYGRVSRYGVVAMASSTDTIGTLASNVADAALILDILAGKDELDPTTLPDRPKSFLPTSTKPLKIAVIKEYMSNSVQAEVRKAVQAQVTKLKKLGHMVEEVSMPSLDLSLAIYYIVVPAEISSNLSRYDGIKFGHSSPNSTDLSELYGQSRDQGFGAEAKRRILIGTYVLSSGYIDAYYNKAQTVRTKLIREFEDAFAKYDALIGPVAPTTAFKLGEHTSDPLQMYLADVMTVGVSLAGLPALSLPVGVDDKKLPIGLQLIGAQQSEPTLFNVAKQLEGEVS